MTSMTSDHFTFSRWLVTYLYKKNNHEYIWNKKCLSNNYVYCFVEQWFLDLLEKNRFVEMGSLWQAYIILDEETKDKWEGKKKETMMTTLTYSFSIVFSGFLLFSSFLRLLFLQKENVSIEYKNSTEKKKKDQLELLLRCYLSGNKSTSLNHVSAFFFFLFSFSQNNFPSI